MAEKKEIEKDCRNVGSEKCGGPELWNSRFGKPSVHCLSLRFKRGWGIQDFAKTCRTNGSGASVGMGQL
jgi:hypothetical protein